MAGTLPARGDERKHTFDSGLDIERAFDQHGGMQRTYVRRRRRVAAGLLLLVVPVLGSPVARAFGGSGGRDDRAVSYVVRAGDTLWSIAEGHTPGEDPRAVIHDIAELNDLGSARIVPGQALALPEPG
jgi:nucleoid-associated protein YgaU